ncbi:MAG: hypothetical protein ABJH85_18725, partial [Paracoccaceae bacterium]
QRPLSADCCAIACRAMGTQDCTNQPRNQRILLLQSRRHPHRTFRTYASAARLMLNPKYKFEIATRVPLHCRMISPDRTFTGSQGWNRSTRIRTHHGYCCQSLRSQIPDFPIEL